MSLSQTLQEIGFVLDLASNGPFCGWQPQKNGSKTRRHRYKKAKKYPEKLNLPFVRENLHVAEATSKRIQQVAEATNKLGNVNIQQVRTDLKAQIRIGL